MTARDRTILLVVGGLALVAAFWFYALKPKRAEIKAADAQIVTQRQRLQTAQATVAAGLQAKASHTADYATVVKLGEAVPTDDDLPSLLYELDAASRGAHVDFDGLARAASGASTTGTSTSGTSSAATQTAASALPPGATVGTAGLATLPFALSFTGSYVDLERFVQSVQRFVRAEGGTLSVSGRLLTIDGLSLTVGDGLSSIKAKLAATAYLSPQAAGSSAATGTAATGTGATPSTGTGTGTGSGSATGTGSGAAASSAPTSSAITEGGNQ
jgi:Tfp pilus assembly protein PilO